ncbi:hypothetical protein NIES2100_35130 [Calothrix sp. NIES-2100]|uniref:hypothetical protein n=1 Tax=Calothrix sp. NIES-2100 TaxID=1954172 RepID=UPI000B608F6D|nr:hypothetical protein NIES2100_35130 [Calothrix sp. NIES-2100]
MANFTTTQVEKLEMVLGYNAPIASVVHSQLSTNFPQVVYDRALVILDDLDAINAKLKEAMDTSYVTESRSTKLSYAQHVRHLKSEGSRLLRELAHILCVAVEYNPYSINLPKVYW